MCQPWVGTKEILRYAVTCFHSQNAIQGPHLVPDVTKIIIVLLLFLANMDTELLSQPR